MTTVYLSASPGLGCPLLSLSTNSTTAFVALIRGAAITGVIVGSPMAPVDGSSVSTACGSQLMHPVCPCCTTWLTPAGIGFTIVASNTTVALLPALSVPMVTCTDVSPAPLPTLIVPCDAVTDPATSEVLGSGTAS